MVDDSYLKDFRYYSRIVMFIICSIQFILFIVYIAVIYDVKDTINENPRISYFYCNNIFHYFSLIFFIILVKTLTNYVMILNL